MVHTVIDFSPTEGVDLRETLQAMHFMAGVDVTLTLMKLRNTQFNRPLAQLSGDDALVRAFLECHGYDPEAYL